jgi:hypothetical protein
MPGSDCYRLLVALSRVKLRQQFPSGVEQPIHDRQAEEKRPAPSRATADDPKAYTRPWGVTLRQQFAADTSSLMKPVLKARSSRSDQMKQRQAIEGVHQGDTLPVSIQCFTAFECLAKNA